MWTKIRLFHSGICVQIIWEKNPLEKIDPLKFGNSKLVSCADTDAGAGGGGEMGWGGGVRTPLKNTPQYRVYKQYWSRFPEKSQSCQASIQCWAINGTSLEEQIGQTKLTNELKTKYKHKNVVKVGKMRKKVGSPLTNFLDPRMHFNPRPIPASHDFCRLLADLHMFLGSLYCNHYGPR